MLAEMQVGPQILGDGARVIARGDRTGAIVTTDAHGRFYEANLRGTLYMGGMKVSTTTAATTFGVGDMSATALPIIGLWNPPTSKFVLVVHQAAVSWSISAATNTGPGPLIWGSSLSNSAITTGNSPFNCSTLANAGSQAKDMSGVALTGLTNTLTVKFGSQIGGGSGRHFSFVETAAGMSGSGTCGGSENFDGSLFVPPGGVLGLFQSVLTVAHLAASRVLWEEVAI